MTVVVRRQCRPTANGGNDQELTWACRLINLTASPAIRRTGHEGHPEKLHTNRSAWVGAAAIDAFSKASCSEPIELAQEHGNAFTHGLTAQQVVIPGEDAAAYHDFQQQLLEDLQPEDSCQADMLHRLAATYWRLRRIPRFEAALMAWLAYENPSYSDLDWSGPGGVWCHVIGTYSPGWS